MATSSASGDNGTLIAIIVGSILGSIVLLLLCIIAVGCLYRRRGSVARKSRMGTLSRNLEVTRRQLGEIVRVKHADRFMPLRLTTSFQVAPNQPRAGLPSVLVGAEQPSFYAM